MISPCEVFPAISVFEANHIDHEAVFYRKLFIDAQGNETSKSWLAEEIG
jgi:hypothetical protein